jgi:hypothetical protein
MNSALMRCVSAASGLACACRTCPERTAMAMAVVDRYAVKGPRASKETLNPKSRPMRRAWIALSAPLPKSSCNMGETARSAAPQRQVSTPHQCAVLHGIWLLYAERNGRVRARTSRLCHQIGVRVTRTTLVALANAGLIALTHLIEAV